MKKAFSFVLVIVMTFSLAACTTGANQQGSADQTGRSTPDSGMTEAESFSTGLSESNGQTDTENREVVFWLPTSLGRTMLFWRMMWMPFRRPA